MYQPRKGRIQRKLFVLLLSGVAPGLTRSPRMYFRIIKGIPEELKDDSKKNIEAALFSLRKRGYIRMSRNKVGEWIPVLTERGRQEATKRVEAHITFPVSKQWDGKWRLFSYDVPEEEKWKRQALSLHLKQLGCHEMHQSVFVYPYECVNEFRELIKMIGVTEYVRYVCAENIEHDDDLRTIYKLK